MVDKFYLMERIRRLLDITQDGSGKKGFSNLCMNNLYPLDGINSLTFAFSLHLLHIFIPKRYDRDKLADPSNMDFRKVQRVNYAFFQPDVQGNIYGTDRWGDPQLLFGPYSSKLGGGIQRCSYDGPHEVNCAFHEHNTGLIYRAHQLGAEVYPSIGGWTLSDNFPTLSANPTSRDAFAKNCIEILTYYDFDGIDIDWEYPGECNIYCLLKSF